MTSENELRKIAADEVREAVARYTALWENHPHLLEGEWERVADMIRTWPILDLPPGDRDGYWRPKHGRNYGNVRGHIPLDSNGQLRHGEWEVVIGRGSGYIHLTPDEAEELASLLLAAAHHERNQ
ncbi:hypothetical protein [Corynebacterium kalidii]